MILKLEQQATDVEQPIIQVQDKNLSANETKFTQRRNIGLLLLLIAVFGIICSFFGTWITVLVKL